MISVTNKMQQNYFFIDYFKSALHVSGDSFACLHGHFDCIYSFLGQCTDSAADRFHLNCVTGWQHSRCTVPKSCIYSHSAPESGRNCRPKHVEQKNKRPTWCYLLFYFTYVLNMFRTLIYPSSGACDCVVELPHRPFCSCFTVCWRSGAVGFQ